MKSAKEYIDRITVMPSNFRYMAESLKINGTLLEQLNKLINEAQIDAYNAALEEAAENAECAWDGQEHIEKCWVDKQSILKLQI